MQCSAVSGNLRSGPISPHTGDQHNPVSPPSTSPENQTHRENSMMTQKTRSWQKTWVCRKRGPEKDQHIFLTIRPGTKTVLVECDAYLWWQYTYLEYIGTVSTLILIECSSIFTLSLQVTMCPHFFWHYGCLEWGGLQDKHNN